MENIIYEDENIKVIVFVEGEITVMNKKYGDDGESVQVTIQGFKDGHLQILSDNTYEPRSSGFDLWL